MRTSLLASIFFLVVTGCGRTPAGAATESADETWKAGVHYETLSADSAAVNAPTLIEVIEFFSYGCGHCYRLEPKIKLWEKTQPGEVKVKQVHVAGRKNLALRAQARLFYTLERLARQDLHGEVFDSIHNKENSLAVNDDEAAALPLQLEFARTHGIEPEEFARTWNSPEVAADLESAVALTSKYLMHGSSTDIVTPSVLINRKYCTDPIRAGSLDGLLKLTGYLVGKEGGTTKIVGKST